MRLSEWTTPAIAALASVTLALAACSPGTGQEASSEVEPEAPPTAEVVEDAPPADSAEALADRLMTALGYDAMVESIPDVFAEASARSLTSCTPATPTTDVRALTRMMREELTAAMPLYYERIRDSYVRRLTIDELRALVEFYDSPAGRRIAEAAAELIYDQFNAQAVIDAAALRAYERLGWCDNAL